MKVLITGGYGFIGSHTAERFYKEGYEVYILDNLSTGNKDNIKIEHKFYNMNIEDKKCCEIFENNEFDVVVHLAAQINAQASIEHPYFDAKSNILGLINMLDLASKNNVKKFIFASSAAVYGSNKKIPLSEKDECSPISPYGVSKLAGEEYCKLWKTMYALDTICLRFSNVYGPRQSIKGDGGVISIFMKNIFNSKILNVYGTGEQTRDFIYIEDVVDAIFKSRNFCYADVLNISSDNQCSVNRILKIIKKLHPFDRVQYTSPKKGDILHSRLSNKYVTYKLNWIPLYSLEQGIERTYIWYKENFKDILD